MSLGEACDATFTLTGDISWVGKQTRLVANAVTLQGLHLVSVARLGPLEVKLPSTNEYAEKPRHNHGTPHHD